MARIPRYRGLLTWQDTAFERRTATKRAKGVFFAMRHKSIRHALSTWADFAQNAVDGQRRLRRALTEWRGECLRSGWHTWTERLAIIRRQRSTVLAFRHRGLLAALLQWESIVVSATERDRLFSRGVSVFQVRSPPPSAHHRPRVPIPARALWPQPLPSRP